jgi:hypothetical protein
LYSAWIFLISGWRALNARVALVCFRVRGKTRILMTTVRKMMARP